MTTEDQIRALSERKILFHGGLTVDLRGEPLPSEDAMASANAVLGKPTVDDLVWSANRLSDLLGVVAIEVRVHPQDWRRLITNYSPRGQVNAEGTSFAVALGPGQAKMISDPSIHLGAWRVSGMDAGEEYAVVEPFAKLVRRIHVPQDYHRCGRGDSRVRAGRDSAFFAAEFS